MNDLPDIATDSTMNLHTDGIAIYSASTSPNEVSHSLSPDLAHIADWIEANKPKMNINKTQLMTLGNKTFRRNVQQINV